MTEISGRSVRQDQRISAERLRAILAYDPDAGVFTRRSDGRILRGSPTEKGYIRVCVEGRRYRLHLLVWLFVHGVWPTLEIDHQNGIRSDNRFSNLREANSTQQKINSSLRSDNKSGARGVYFSKPAGKWLAKIKLHGKVKHLGLFPTVELAAAAYESAAVEIFAEWRRAA